MYDLCAYVVVVPGSMLNAGIYIYNYVYSIHGWFVLGSLYLVLKEDFHALWWTCVMTKCMQLMAAWQVCVF